MREIKFKCWLPNSKKMTYTHTIEELMDFLFSINDDPDQQVKEALSEVKQQIKSTILMLSAHPQNQPGSEFEDRVNGLEKVLAKLKEGE